MIEEKKGWGWWAGSAPDGMMIVGPYDTKAEAIEAAVNDGFGEWLDESEDPPVWKNTFVVLEARQDPLRLADWIDLEWIVEKADENLANSDRVDSEFDDGPWFEVTPEQEESLRRSLAAACDEWQRQNNLVFTCCTFSASRNMETITTRALRAISTQEGQP